MADRLRLNIGCGRKHHPGEINIDVVPPADLLCDVTDGLPYADGTCEFIAAHNFLEHLDSAELIAVLNECHRLLLPGGRMDIRVPNAHRAFNNAVKDPTHKRLFVPDTFRYWMNGERLYVQFGRSYGFLPWRVIELTASHQIHVLQEAVEKA